MIKVLDKQNCCGCSACVQACPKHCIVFDEDERGFRYPIINKEQCIKCGLCEKVCPCLNQGEPQKPLNVYAAINPNEEIRMKSSSGGIFTMLAESVINEGGVVFGARFDNNWEVVHDYTETIEGLELFRGSKYVQSVIGNSYKKTQDFLKKGHKVLFSGTPCQIAGLKHFLRKDYENLLTVDVVCHGVPSPFVWRKYLNETLESIRAKRVDGKNTVLSALSPDEIPVITGISFRDKSTGWKKFGFVIRGKSAFKADKNSVLSSVNKEIELIHETLDKNVFMQLFIRNVILRPSCYSCPARCGKSSSDITIADFWGIENYNKKLCDDKGVSMLLVNTIKGKELLNILNINLYSQSYGEALLGNPQIEKGASLNNYSTVFWSQFFKYGFKKEKLYMKYANPTMMMRIVGKIKRLLLICQK